jgi:hypothetical protein
MENIKWVYWPDSRAVTKGSLNLKNFEQSLEERSSKYPNFKPSEQAIQLANEIKEKGYTKLNKYLDTNLIDDVFNEVEKILDNKDNPFNQDQISQKEAKSTKPYIQVLQPFLNVPKINSFVFDKLITEVAGAYIGCMPALSTCNLRKSFVNNLQEQGTQIYHVDPNSPKFVKVFVYLNDVDEFGGPFSFVEGSHTKKFELNGLNWNSKYSWDLHTINSIYGEEKVKLMTAKKGDVIIADTNGWHRGTKPTKKERTMLTIDYACHPEFFEIKQTFKISKEVVNSLSSDVVPLCDYLKIV